MALADGHLALTDMVPRSDFPASCRRPSRVARDFGTGASSLLNNQFTCTARPDSKVSIILFERSLSVFIAMVLLLSTDTGKCKVSQRFSPSVAIECHGTLSFLISLVSSNSLMTLLPIS